MLSDRHVAATLSGPGTSVELIDYLWTGNWVPTEQQSVHTLSKLIAPIKLVEQWILGDCKMRRGSSLAFIPANVPLGILPEQQKARFGVYQFSQDRFDAATESCHDWDSIDLRQCGDVRSPLLEGVVGRLIQEAVSPGLASDIMVESLSVVAMIELAHHLDRTKSKRTQIRGGLAPWQMRRITDYIENRHDAPVLVADLAQLCEISEGHLQRAYKQSTGRTLHSYVEDLRLARAKAMLETKDMPIAAIATALGFANASGFSIAFRRAAAEAPSAYRRRVTRQWSARTDASSRPTAAA